MEIRLNDTFLLQATNGKNYKIRIVSINNCIELSYKYGFDICDENGNYAGDVLFFRDDFFEINKDRLKKIEE